jgi:DNA-binding NarL/FixJ family response regulator
MPMLNPMVERGQEIKRDAIIIIDDELLSQDCLAEAMRGAFPQTLVIGSPSIEELQRPDGTAIIVVLLKVKAQPIVRHNLCQDIRTIARYCPKTPIVVISTGEDASSIGEAIEAGAQGVIPVTASFKIAVAALQLVMAGGTYYPHPVSNGLKAIDNMLGLANAVVALPAAPSSASLETALPPSTVKVSDAPGAEGANGVSTTFTAREAQVLAALHRGHSNKWIAHHLNLSENTIKVHIRHIMRKLHATNRTEAVILSQHLVPNTGDQAPEEATRV